MSFVTMRDNLIAHFNQITKDANNVFVVNVDKDEMWNLYLDSFPKGTNEVYRKRREHDCSCCRSFIKAIGNVVVIKNSKITTIWDFNAEDPVYQPSIDALNAFIKSKTVTDVFLSKFNRIGSEHTFEKLEDGSIKTWEHFYLQLPGRFVNNSYKSIPDLQGDFRDTKNVFKRSLDEITEDSVLTVLELISSNSLYRGEEWKAVLEKFLQYKRKYMALSEADKDNYTWENSAAAGNVIGRIRNHSIGTLLVNISEDMDLDLAVRKYEQIVAPSSYKRPKAIFTKKMLDDAKNTIEELGYMDSLARRYATLDDITVNNILFSNKDSAKRISGASVFDEMEKEIAVNPKKFNKVEEVPIEKFISDVLPAAREFEVLFENKHSSNLVSLIAPVNKDSKTMFKWNNNFSWSYAGNITDSQIRENVKSAGGKVDGVLRFSIQWNECGTDNCDLDAHCIEPNNHKIFFGSDKKPHLSSMGGQLDVDIIAPHGKVAVENITWGNLSKMADGVYRFMVNQYSGAVKKGFRAEIEFDGQIYSFDYNKPMRSGETVRVADVTLKDGVFTIKEYITSSMSAKSIWGITTNQFVPVSVMCYSPNYWDEQNGIGNKHYFFMLKNCINDEAPNGFFNEYLKQELVQHKRVFEALGSKMRVEPSDDQLSGLGFSSTKRNELIVKVKGNTERVMKIKF
nr:MAG TPA: hypothetical protein [Caudoviricetes sp.]